MKPMPDADENRRLGAIETRKADKLPPGKMRDEHRRKAVAHESSAHARDWRDSNLHKPND
jgi:hypothetical protein